MILAHDIFQWINISTFHFSLLWLNFMIIQGLKDGIYYFRFMFFNSLMVSCMYNDELYIMNYTCFLPPIVSFATHLPPTVVSSLCDSHAFIRVAFMSMGGRLFTGAWAACQGLFHWRKWPPLSKYKLPVDLQDVWSFMNPSSVQDEVQRGPVLWR